MMDIVLIGRSDDARNVCFSKDRGIAGTPDVRPEIGFVMRGRVDLPHIKVVAVRRPKQDSFSLVDDFEIGFHAELRDARCARDENALSPGSGEPALRRLFAPGKVRPLVALKSEP